MRGTAGAARAGPWSSIRGRRQRAARPAARRRDPLRRGGHRHGRRLRRARRGDPGPRHRPYYVPGGGSNAIGALGYVDAGLELLTQANAIGLRIDAVVHGSGSTGTQAGLVCGLEGANSGIDVLGICVSGPAAAQVDAVHATASATAAHAGIRGGINRARVMANGDHVGPGYGIPTAATLEAIRLAACHEGLLLDPVYTGKAMAGLIDLCRAGFFTRDQNIVFLHTGGAAALFAYEADLAGMRDARRVTS
jgi:L-cysteate sulfo-lyase